MSTAVNHFWSWFNNHQSKLKALTTNTKNKKHYLYWLDWHLQFYCPGLEYILVFPKHKKKKTEMLISAKGRQELFKMAIDLEKAAPKLRHWKFTALIQPQTDFDEMEAGIDEPYVLQDITLKASGLKFIPLEYDSEKKIDMIVYLRNFTFILTTKIYCS